MQPGVKICSTLSGHGSFDVYTYPPASLYIKLPEEIVHFVPADESAFQQDWGGTIVTIAAKVFDLPQRSTIIITTANLTITVNVIRGSTKQADTQLIIHDPDHEQRLSAFAKALKVAQKQVEPMARERAEIVDLEELAQTSGGMERIRGPDIIRNKEGLVVLRTKGIIRVGSKRFLLFSIQNLSPENFEVRRVRVWLDQKEVTANWRVGRTTIIPNDESQGALTLPASGPHGRSASAKVTIEESDPKRNIDLGGLEIP
jgi:hypothetical protein